MSTKGSVRVDLLGGTLDINPIGLILKNAVTLNLATSLKANCEILITQKNGINIESMDYNSKIFYSSTQFNQKNLDSDFFGPLSFIANIIYYFKLYKNFDLVLSSGSPTGAGLGGSSAMGITIFKALAKLTNRSFSHNEAIAIVKDIEAKTLDSGPTGFQDYYPALYGGILALKQSYGTVIVSQLYSDSFKQFLEKRITLIYSNISRNSGINNWEVIKGFFDKNERIRSGLQSIANISSDGLTCIKNNKSEELLKLIGKEGNLRAKLFPGIVPIEILQIIEKVKQVDPSSNYKICGAGGGGCFLITHKESTKTKIRNMIKKETTMEILAFIIEPPL